MLTSLFKASQAQQLENLTFVKLPNASVLSLPELDNRMMTITPIKAAAAQAGIECA